MNVQWKRLDFSISYMPMVTARLGSTAWLPFTPPISICAADMGLIVSLRVLQLRRESMSDGSPSMAGGSLKATWPVMPSPAQQTSAPPISSISSVTFSGASGSGKMTFSGKGRWSSSRWAKNVSSMKRRKLSG